MADRQRTGCSVSGDRYRDVVSTNWGWVLAARWRALPAEIWILVVARTVNHLGAFTLPFLTVVLVNDFRTPVATAGLIVALFGAATIPSAVPSIGHDEGGVSGPSAMIIKW